MCHVQSSLFPTEQYDSNNLALSLSLSLSLSLFSPPSCHTLMISGITCVPLWALNSFENRSKSLEAKFGKYDWGKPVNVLLS
jgi:hypothetical protein